MGQATDADRVACQIGRHPLGGKAFMEQNAGRGTGAAPEDGLAADMVKRQAVQPEIAGTERQALVGGGSGGIEIGGTQQDGARLAFTAAGRDDQRGCGGQGSGRRIIARAAVDWPERAILQAGGTGQVGQLKAATAGAPGLAGICLAGGEGCATGQPFGERPVLVASDQRRGFRRLTGGKAEVVGERGGSLHKRLIIGRTQGASGEVNQEISRPAGNLPADLTLSFRQPRYDPSKASVTMLFALPTVIVVRRTSVICRNG